MIAIIIAVLALVLALVMYVKYRETADRVYELEGQLLGAENRCEQQYVIERDLKANIDTIRQRSLRYSSEASEFAEAIRKNKITKPIKDKARRYA